jgi:hypothetical protein
MPEIRKRLTAKHAGEMLDLFKECEAVDFTRKNVYAVVAWIVEHANKYTDQQIVDVFYNMVTCSNIENYKSNQKVFKYDDWGCREERLATTHVKLAYRIVTRWGGINKSAFEFDRDTLSSYAQEHLQDLCVVGRLIGWDNEASDPRITGYHTAKWRSGKSETFYALDGRLMFEVKCFYNGNMHIRFDPAFILALNVAVGKLRGWIHNGAQAAAELNEPAAAALFDSMLLKIGVGTNGQLALPVPPQASPKKRRYKRKVKLKLKTLDAKENNASSHSP